MKARFALLFPYLCAAFVIGCIIWGNARTDVISIATNEEHTAICPGCSRELDIATAGCTRESAGRTLYFCCSGCATDFEHAMAVSATSHPGTHVDPVCNMEVGERIALETPGATFYFCAERCRELFKADTRRYLTAVCMVCRADGSFTPVTDEARYEASWQGRTYRFCSEDHRATFRGDPAGSFLHSMWGIPAWLYYASIAVILVLSFGILEWKAGRKGPRSRSGGNAERIDLFRSGFLRGLLVAPRTRFVLQAFLVAVFLTILAAGLFGNQLPSKNIAPILTWTIWWGGLVWLVLYAGKAWCYVCPWDALSDWAEGLRFWGKKKSGQSLGLAWPRALRNIWPATVLFVGLTWIELGFGVTMKPRATAWLGLGMLGLAFVGAFIFERKSFCRYGCLVGRISGLYALFAPVEIRAAEGDACRTCRTHSCYKGSAKGEACPTFEHLATMDQNTYCIACMECAKTCEKGNVSLNLRPWGADLATHRRPRSDEAYLALLMLSLTGFHGLTMTPVWRSVVTSIETTLGMGETASFTAGMIAVMLAPGLLYAGLVALSRWWARTAEIGYREYFISYAYALLPIALFYHLAHNSEHLLLEGQKVLALLSDPFGYEWNLFGTRDWSPAPLVDLPTLWLVQVFFVTIGHVFSLWVARCTAGRLFDDERAARRSQVPMLVAMIAFSLMSLWLLKQPMEMRTSAM